MKKIKIFLSAITMLVCLSSCGKAKDSATAPKLATASAKATFDEDVKNNNVRIYLQGGIISAIKKEDHLFEEKYGIKYHDFGVVPENIDYYSRYNQQVFNYLSGKFGDTWKKELNTAAFGLR